MKNYKLLLGLAAGLFFAGCSTDDLGNDSPTLDKDEIRYLNVSICASGSATRAPGFDAGTTTENAIDEVYFFFYDIDGNPTSQSIPVTGLTFTDQGITDPSVEKKANQTLTVQLKKGEKLPAYIVCLLNDYNSDYENNNMSELRLKTTTVIANNKAGTDYFKMNNSVYYGTNTVTGEQQVRLFGTPVQAEQLYRSQTDAEAHPAVNIYVERYAAKLSVKQETANNIQAYAVNGYTLTFQPLAWGLNADVKTSYIAKRFYMETAPADPDTNTAPRDQRPATYSDVNNILTPWPWNDETHHRTYWACSPSYYGLAFPEVTDDMLDPAPEKPDYQLEYYSYKDLSELPTASARKVGDLCQAFGTDATTLYVRENTTSSQVGQAANPKAAVPSVVLTGWYKVERTDATKPAIAEKETFYLYGRTNDKENLYNAEGIKKVFLEAQKVLDNKATEGQYLDPTTGHAALKVMHPSKETRAEAGIKVPARYVTLQIDPKVDYSDLYYRDNDGIWKKVKGTKDGTAYDDINKVNARLLQMLGYAQMYEEAACYFSVPVKHLRFQETNNPNKDKEPTDEEFNWEDIRPGDFGLVRNHSYQINIKSIKGLATGLSDKDAPIVPPLDADPYYVSYQINILKWAVVPTQDVNL